MDEWMDERMDGWMDGWMDAWMGRRSVGRHACMHACMLAPVPCAGMFSIGLLSASGFKLSTSRPTGRSFSQSRVRSRSRGYRRLVVPLGLQERFRDFRRISSAAVSICSVESKGGRLQISLWLKPTQAEPKPGDGTRQGLSWVLSLEGLTRRTEASFGWQAGA